MHDVLYGLIGEWGQIDRCILADTLVDLENKFNTYYCPGAPPLACPAIGRASCPLAYYAARAVAMVNKNGHTHILICRLHETIPEESPRGTW